MDVSEEHVAVYFSVGLCTVRLRLTYETRLQEMITPNMERRDGSIATNIVTVFYCM
jgi:hypothetical protein